MGQTHKPIAIRLDGLEVCFGLPVAEHFTCSSIVSLVDTVAALSRIGIPVVFQPQTSLSIVQKARNLVVHEFLKRPKCNRLFWIDADVSWNSNDLIRILALSQILPCVGAAYPTNTDGALVAGSESGGTPERRTGTFLPINVMSEAATMCEQPFDLIKIDSMELDFCCFQREVIENLARRAPRFRYCGEEVAEIFRSRDSDVFDDIRTLGYEVWGDTEVRLSRKGIHAYGERRRESLIPTPVLSESERAFIKELLTDE